MDTYNITGWTKNDPLLKLQSAGIGWIKESSTLRKGEDSICYQEFKGNIAVLHYLSISAKSEGHLEFSSALPVTQLFLLLRGSIQIRNSEGTEESLIREKTYVLSCLPRGRYSICYDPGHTEILYFSIDERNKHYLNEFVHLRALLDQEETPVMFCPAVRLSHEVYKIIFHLFRQRNIGFKLLQHSLQQTLFVLFARYDMEIYYQNNRYEHSGKYCHMIDSIVHEIEEAPSRRQTESYFMEKYGLSRATLIRHFKLQTQTTIAAYRTRQSMYLAEEMIVNGEQVQSIALKLGYSDVNTFCTAFKNHTGQRALEYRWAKKAEMQSF